ncbi:acyl-CoA thioesterase-1 [Roseospirillum parvum]|uniref:Acyl-CoA thioesterase-1 n=2 Tax=Roseospirillum parvum TaxID=83401 RepID=A0A1G8B6U5_9PROT|nr:acyl-CoA thioesterase-1 [Roseospirillum parvum]
MLAGLLGLALALGLAYGAPIGDVNASQPAAPLRILALGDSLTAGYNLPQGAGFPAQLEAALTARGHAVEVINGGVSGDTSAGGLSRLAWQLGDTPPDAAIVELGANDGLRGLDPGRTEANLSQLIARLKGTGVAVLLAGMMAPPNLGPEYGEAFNGLYPRLADQHEVLLYPFFLEGVAAQPELLQPDGLHPTEEGVAEIVRRMLPKVEELIARATP